jgi:exodeoxyribonuclease VII small subunit
MFIRGFKRSIPVGLLIYPPSSIGEGQLLFYNRPTRQKKAYLLGYEEGDLRIKCQAITGRKRRHCKKSNYTEYLTFFRAPKAILHMRVFFCSLWLILNLNDSVCKAQSDSISYWVESGIKLFEEGVKLSRTCQTELDEAEQKVELLLGQDSQGQAVVQPFKT